MKLLAAQLLQVEILKHKSKYKGRQFDNNLKWIIKIPLIFHRNVDGLVQELNSTNC